MSKPTEEVRKALPTAERGWILRLCEEVERLEKRIEAAYREGYKDNDYPFTTVDAAWLASTARQGVE